VRTHLLQVAEAVRLQAPSSGSEMTDHVQGTHLKLSTEQPRVILAWLRAVAAATRDNSVFNSQLASAAIKRFKLPKPHGATSLEVVGLPLETPGLYIVEIESPRLGAALLGKPQSMFVPTSAWGRTSPCISNWERRAPSSGS
jgi:hypothetical protein